jgi:hypothetical protein
MEDAIEWILMRKKTKVMKISRKPSQSQVMMDQKQLVNVEYLKYSVA